MNELISVIVPIYNNEKFLNRCVNSILNQTYKNLEIILVDDGSNDCSLEICKEFKKKDKRIKVLSQRNMGANQARRNGIMSSTGRYIGFVDSDDYIDKEMYKYLYDLILKYNSDIAVCAHKIIKNGIVTDLVNVRKNEITINRVEAMKMLIEDKEVNSFSCDKLFKKELIIDAKFIDLSYHEDIANLIGIFGKSNTVTIGCLPLYNYVRNPNSTSLNLTPTKTYHSFLAYLEVQKFIESNYASLTSLSIIRMAHAAVASINVFIRNNLEKENKKEIAYIRRIIKNNIFSILKNRKIHLTCKLYCILSIFSMRLYKKICLKNINGVKK